MDVNITAGQFVEDIGRIENEFGHDNAMGGDFPGGHQLGANGQRDAGFVGK